MIKLGAKVVDKISGLKGVAVAQCIYIQGCNHIGIQAPAKDGAIPPIQWIDEPHVRVVKATPRSGMAQIESLARAEARRLKRKLGGPSTGGNPVKRTP